MCICYFVMGNDGSLLSHLMNDIIATYARVSYVVQQWLVIGVDCSFVAVPRLVGGGQRTMGHG